MTRYELSFRPTFFNESLNLPKQVSKLVSQKLKVLGVDPHSAHGDAKKLKGYANVYRARVGDYRIFYSIGQGWIKLLSVRKRDDRTYDAELPEVAPPTMSPDQEALVPQESGVGYRVSRVRSLGSGLGSWGAGPCVLSTPR
ncbi:type II toxin-antitoxin system RelE family toxin [Candidatus Chloroploca asiatica]|uniref:Addiction module toxin RelE n=1 Tax=Candidatus Chloroploca asiatica TaxID=1506545 RepID=A0A2H3LDD8_9CHLR|nr:type II toxin-antitoxin system RelE/ParE family toxin [Candidatus Chloroploca asiatica]PDW00591.1 hypothetical protein A9Q02_09380 [Candidatus Chloroploca asiatica]